MPITIMNVDCMMLLDSFNGSYWKLLMSTCCSSPSCQKSYKKLEKKRLYCVEVDHLVHCTRVDWNEALLVTGGRQSTLCRQALMTFSKTSWLLKRSLNTLKCSVIVVASGPRSRDCTIFFTLRASSITHLHCTRITVHTSLSPLEQLTWQEAQRGTPNIWELP